MGLFGGKKKQKEDILQEPARAKKSGKKKDRIREFFSARPWCFWGIVVSFACAVVFSSFYGVFRANAELHMDDPLESESNISWLFQTCYLLYRDLCNAQSREQLDYVDVYLEAEEGYEWILDERQLQEYKDFLENSRVESWGEEGIEGISRESLEYMLRERAMDDEYLIEYLREAFRTGMIPADLLEDFVLEGLLEQDWLDVILAESADTDYATDPSDTNSGAGSGYYGEDGSYLLNWEECSAIQSKVGELQDNFNSLENSFQNLNSNYNYIIRDNNTGRYLTNMSEEDMELRLSDQYFLLSFTFDSTGNVSIGQAFCGEDKTLIRKNANGAVREDSLQETIASNLSAFKNFIRVMQPVDCNVTFAVPSSARTGTFSENIYISESRSNSGYTSYHVSYNSNGYTNLAYIDAGIGGILFLTMLGMALLGMFLPVLKGTEPWKDERICSVSLETLFVFGFVLGGIAGEWIMRMIVSVSSGRAGGVFIEVLGADTEFLPMLLNLLTLTVFFFCCWYIGICARALIKYGAAGYIRRRSLIYRFFPFMKSKAVGVYEAAAHMDLTKNAHKAIIKLLLGNAVILFIISSLWIGGFAITLVYSFVLYLILRKYISELQKRYVILLKAVDEIAEGKLNVTINEDLGVFEPFRSQVFKIQDGLQKAVDAQIKSQRMKAELVTNMSHDLKTPLTAIITYVNLLKEKDITEAQRMEYLDTLERKSLRLKSLIEDLFEFSKANSENIILNIMDVDIMNLLKQVAFEMSDKISASRLDVRMNLTEEKVVLPLDSQKTYRIYENLFGNIAKYALPGTRVYVNGFRIDDMVVITLKNISAQEITVDPNELTERFVRGDSSRNTEGSGLGLAIAKSFTELQGGQLSLEVDGDLFKVTTAWHIAALS